MSRIRSKTGKTYGISSQIVSRRDSGIFLISTTTQNSKVSDVMEGILDIYRDCTSNGITGEELEKAKQFAAGNLAFQLEGIGNVAEKLLWLRFFGYDNSYIENHAAIINSIGIEQVNDALKNVLASEHFVISAVGKRTEVQRSLEKFGDVRVVNFRSDP
jgi:predicted Zn-dependent peptidase